MHYEYKPMVVFLYQIHSYKFEYTLSTSIYKYPTYDFDGDRVMRVAHFTLVNLSAKASAT